MIPTDSKERKDAPVHSGFNAYFPDAIVEVARLSQTGNDKHNPGEPLHWSRDKSCDHGDCISRHQLEWDQYDDDGYYHAVKVAWRAMAQLQVLLEKRENERPKFSYAPGEWVPMGKSTREEKAAKIFNNAFELDQRAEREVGESIFGGYDGNGDWVDSDPAVTGAQAERLAVKGAALRAWEEYYDLQESK